MVETRDVDQGSGQGVLEANIAISVDRDKLGAADNAHEIVAEVEQLRGLADGRVNVAKNVAGAAIEKRQRVIIADHPELGSAPLPT